MAYSKVAWSAGEPLNFDKLQQMALNDELIRQEILARPYGRFGWAHYQGTAKTATSGVFTTICTASNVVIPSGRYIKIIVKCKATSATTDLNVGFRVFMDGATEVLYCNTPVATAGGIQSAATVTGFALKNNISAGTHTFALQITNDTGVAGTASTDSVSFYTDAIIMSIEDGGPYNV